MWKVAKITNDVDMKYFNNSKIDIIYSHSPFNYKVIHNKSK